jgi:hypothetical protein
VPLADITLDLRGFLLRRLPQLLGLLLRVGDDIARLLFGAAAMRR